MRVLRCYRLFLLLRMHVQPVRDRMGARHAQMRGKERITALRSVARHTNRTALARTCMAGRCTQDICMSTQALSPKQATSRLWLRHMRVWQSRQPDVPGFCTTFSVRTDSSHGSSSKNTSATSFSVSSSNVRRRSAGSKASSSMASQSSGPSAQPPPARAAIKRTHGRQRIASVAPASKGGVFIRHDSS